MKRRSGWWWKAGQSFVEYILVLAVIIAAFVAGSAVIKGSIQNDLMGAAKDQITKATTQWKAKQ